MDRLCRSREWGVRFGNMGMEVSFGVDVFREFLISFLMYNFFSVFGLVLFWILGSFFFFLFVFYEFGDGWVYLWNGDEVVDMDLNIIFLNLIILGSVVIYVLDEGLR